MYAAEAAAAEPEKPAIVMATGGDVVTFGEYEATANRFAHLLRETGLRRRDNMAIFMENDPRMLMAEGGAERTGLYYTCVNSYLSAEEVAYIVNDSEARLVVTSTAKADVAFQLPALCPKVERWVLVGSGGAPDAPFEDWNSAVARHPDGPVADEQLGTPMLYSSGTTGRPKGILRPLPDAHPGENLAIFQGLKAPWNLRAGRIY